jgi:hypothetical protein
MTEFQLEVKFSANYTNDHIKSTEHNNYVSDLLVAEKEIFEEINEENVTLFLNSSAKEMFVDEYVPYDERPEAYIVPFIFSIIFIVGLIGNGTLVQIFIRHKSMRNLPNTFILCLAVGDLLVIVGTIPFISIIYTLDSWPFGQFLCKLSEFMRDVSIGITVLTLSVLSFDRYLAIASPFHKVKEKCSKKVTVAIVTALWTVSVVFAIPGAYNSHILMYNISDNIQVNVCYPFPQEFGEWYPKMIVLLKFLLLYVIPLVAISTFYALMARRLFKSSQQIVGLDVNHCNHIQLRKKVAKMVFTLAIIFAICFLPNHSKYISIFQY